jgi:hypothetical protein
MTYRQIELRILLILLPSVLMVNAERDLLRLLMDWPLRGPGSADTGTSSCIEEAALWRSRGLRALHAGSSFELPPLAAEARSVVTHRKCYSAAGSLLPCGGLDAGVEGRLDGW